eukprot:Nitzschia sp. Nitz4//scaffold2_size372955//358792//359949//NITZ4_000480-RA/size372955-processed-gene-0.71-mRNA-1//1//CDS//3329546949//3614//frame0
MTTNDESNTAQSEYIEHITTPLNACSLESHAPISLPNNESVWPLLLGCYQLDEASGYRQGQLDLYAAHHDDSTSSFQLGKPVHSLTDISGVLDGKWLNEERLYATAHATGEVQIHQLQTTQDSIQLQSLGQTDSSPDVSTGLCLSLAWDQQPVGNGTRQLVSSYSDGQVALWNVPIPSCGGEGSSSPIEPELVSSWTAHTLFRTTPAEVWAASLANNTPSSLVLTGGDEGSLRLWDVQQTQRPIHNHADWFGAGVTVISPHPSRPLVAVGSYDETVALVDLRKPSEPLYHSTSLGGGIWRLKWHPDEQACDGRLLVAAMHGGCRVVDVDTAEEVQDKMQIRQAFDRHQSMAYGADWLFYRGTKSNSTAVSCSFYDSALYSWVVKP